MAKTASLDESALAPKADELPAGDWPHRALWERVALEAPLDLFADYAACE